MEIKSQDEYLKNGNEHIQKLALEMIKQMSDITDLECAILTVGGTVGRKIKVDFPEILDKKIIEEITNLMSTNFQIQEIKRNNEEFEIKFILSEKKKMLECA